MTEAESFLWHRPMPRLQVGLAYLWKQGAFRVLGNYVLVEETASLPNLKVGAGVQGIGTGNPGFFATSEKNFVSSSGSFNLYAGLATRTNESHLHGVGGLRFTTLDSWSVGLQLDGHQTSAYLTRRVGDVVFGAFLIEWERPGWLVGLRF